MTKSTHVRQLVVDLRTGTVAELMDEIALADEVGGRKVYLRDVHGGPEWTRPAVGIRPATPEEIAGIDSAAHNAVLDHADKCSACRARDDGGYCQAAATLLRRAATARTLQ